MLPKNIHIFKQEINNKNRNISIFSNFFRKQLNIQENMSPHYDTGNNIFTLYFYIQSRKIWKRKKKRIKRENKGKIEL